ncbi:MAG: nitroreductase family deazaflavin-dependent oxidoreductase [Anaerolineales bacterium]|nr:nitroreductase family deazaflavin-dependent oxidoreductase [Anaerolineales bacterium]
MGNDVPTDRQNSQEPGIPDFAFYIINPLMKLILRTPFHGLVSDDLTLITFTGRKTGKQYTTPVGYIKMNGSIMMFTNSPWWRNIKEQSSITLRLKGKRVQGQAEIVSAPDLIREYLQKMVEKRGAEMVQRMGLADITPEGELELDPKAVEDKKYIQFKPE